MAISVNRVTLVGNVGADPEVKGTGDGFVTLNVATSETWKDRDTGERREKTEWHRVVVFNKAASEFAKKYVKRGDLVYVEGRIESRKWSDNEGVERTVYEIVVPAFEGVLKSMPRDGGNRQESRSESRSERREDRGVSDRGRSSGGYGGGGFSRDLDDDIPF